MDRTATWAPVPSPTRATGTPATLRKFAERSHDELTGASELYPTSNAGADAKGEEYTDATNMEKVGEAPSPAVVAPDRSSQRPREACQTTGAPVGAGFGSRLDFRLTIFPPCAHSRHAPAFGKRCRC